MDSTQPTPTIALAVAALILVVSMVAGALGSGDAEVPCQAGEVYVIDTEQCVSETDHEAHDEHPITSEEREQGVTEPWHRAGTTTTTVDALSLSASTIEQHGMSCNASVAPTVNMNELSRTCLMQLDIACNPDQYVGYVALPGFPPIQCPWPAADPDAESPANSIPPFPEEWILP